MLTMNPKGAFILTATVLLIGSVLSIGISVPQQARALEEEEEKAKNCFLVILPGEDGGEGSPVNDPQELCYKSKKECEQTRQGLIDNEDTQVLTECYKKKIQSENDVD